MLDQLPYIKPNCKRHRERKCSPFAKKYDDTAQIYRYRSRKLKQEMHLSRDIKGNIL